MCLVPALSIATSRHHVDPFHRWESFDVEGTEARDLHGSCRGASRTVPPPHPLSLDPVIPTATVSATTISIAEDTSITSDCRVALGTTQQHNCLGRVKGRIPCIRLARQSHARQLSSLHHPIASLLSHVFCALLALSLVTSCVSSLAGHLHLTCVITSST